MHGGLQRLRDIFWNPEERRLRAPLRIIIQFIFVFGLLAIVTSDTVLGPLQLKTLPEPFALVSVILIPVSVYLVGLVVAARFLDRRPVRNFGLNVDREWLREFGVGFAVGSLLISGGFLFMIAFGWATVTDALAANSVLAFVGGVTVLWAAIIIVFVIQYANAAYVIKNAAEGLAGYITPGQAVAVAVLLRVLLGVYVFSSNPAASTYAIFVEVLLQSIVLIAYAYTGNVGFSVGFATGWTGFILIVFDGSAAGLTSPMSLLGVDYTGPAAITGGGFGVDGGIVALFATVFGLFFLFGWLRLTDRLTIPERIYRRVDRLDDPQE